MNYEKCCSSTRGVDYAPHTLLKVRSADIGVDEEEKEGIFCEQ
jgi:hypothetical protein